MYKPIIMEKTDIQSVLCMACLCVGRSPQELTDEKLKQYYLDTLNEIPLCNKPVTTPVICWECVALLKKVLSFREQVKDSYRILQTYTHENLYECLLSDVSRPPRLKVHVNNPMVISPSDGGRQVFKEEVKIEYCSDNDGNAATPSKIQNGGQDSGERIKINISNVSNVKHKSRSNTRDSASDTRVQRIKEGHIEVTLEVDSCKKEEKDSLADLTPDDRVSTPDVSESEVEDTKNLLDVKRERIKKINTKMKNSRKVVKRLQTVKKIRKPLKEQSNQKIITLELTYEEMLAERARDALREGYTKAEYKCDTCLIGFNYHKSYKAHLVAKHSQDIGNYSCPICKTVIPSVESFTAHYKRHMRRYECSICRKRTVDVKAMQQHFYSTHEIALKEYTCNLCGQVSNSIDTHRYHKDSHKARVQCNECEKTFSHRAGLMNHRHAVHELKNVFPCNVCSKVFRWKTSLKRHLEKHNIKSKSSVGGAYCAECDIGFSSVCSLQRHLRNSLKHVTHDQLKFICDHCKRRFADKTKLRDHIEEKHLHRTYQCHICQKSSKNRVGLEQHVRNVHKGRPNNKMCHHCGKGFPTKVQLESHIRTHTGERPFICEYCPTTFSQQSNLYKHHRQVHLNIKSKRYPLCKKRRDGTRTDDPPNACATEHAPVVIQYGMSENIFGL